MVVPDNTIELLSPAGQTLSLKCPEEILLAELAIKHVLPKCFDQFVSNLNDEFNDSNIQRIAKAFNIMVSTIKPIQTTCSPAIACKLLNHSYGRVVDCPKKLNNVKPFSSNVYGETPVKSICELMEHLEIGPEDVFMDVGAGMGQVVLMVSGTQNVKKCYGIEQMPIPYSYSTAMKNTFVGLMEWFNFPMRPCELLHGDFTADTFKKQFEETTIFFINNKVFSPELNNWLYKYKYISSLT